MAQLPLIDLLRAMDSFRTGNPSSCGGHQPLRAAGSFAHHYNYSPHHQSTHLPKFPAKKPIPDTTFADQQNGFFHQNPSLSYFVHQEQFARPGPLKIVILSWQSSIRQGKEVLATAISTVVSILLYVVYSALIYIFGEPLQILYHLRTSSKIELLLTLLIAELLVRYLPGFGEPIRSNGGGDWYSLAGDRDGIVGSAQWIIYVPSSFSVVPTGSALSG
jgi:hypothetical protein